MDISFITINYNGVGDTLEFIASIKERVLSVSYEIIVVDNCSAGNDAEQIAQAHPDVKVVRAERNLGFAGGNNLALPYAEGTYLCFINNDTLIGKDGFCEIIQTFIDQPSIGMISSKLRYAAEPETIQYAGFTPLSLITLRNAGIGNGEKDSGQHDIAQATAFPHGACMMIPAKVLQEVGAMYEGYFLYYEELDWAEMIHRKGYEIYYQPACVVLHKESRTTGDGSPLKAYYLTRNRLLFAKRNRTGCIRLLCYIYLTIVALVRSIKAPAAHSRMMKQGIRDFYRGRYGAFNTQPDER